MAKLSDKVMKEAEDALLNGTKMPTGVCVDFSRNPALFACGELERRVANGEVSVSWDGTKVFDLKTGELTEGKPIDRSMPVTLMEMANAVEGTTPEATGADTATTDNTPAGVARARR